MVLPYWLNSPIIWNGSVCLKRHSNKGFHQPLLLLRGVRPPDVRVKSGSKWFLHSSYMRISVQLMQRLRGLDVLVMADYWKWFRRLSRLRMRCLIFKGQAPRYIVFREAYSVHKSDDWKGGFSFFGVLSISRHQSSQDDDFTIYGFTLERCDLR